MGNRSFVYPGVGQASAGPARTAQATAAKTIPFDYAFKFDLTGKRGNKAQDVVEISMEGVFVTVSIGYSAVRDEQKNPRTFVPTFNSRTTPQPPVLVPIMESPTSDDLFATEALVTAAPEAQIAVVAVSPRLGGLVREASETQIDVVEVPPPFMVSIIGPIPAAEDGRASIEFEDPVQTGSFLRAWDKTNGLFGQVVEVGLTTTPVIGPDPSSRRLPAVGGTAVTVFGSLNDNVGLFLLPAGGGLSSHIGNIFLSTNVPNPKTGQQTRTGQNTIPLSAPLIAGDALLVGTVPLDPLRFSMYSVPRPTFSSITLGAIADGLESVNADLTQGFRVNPTFANLLTANVTLDSLANGTLNRAFEAGSRASEEVSFLYSLDVLGSGRELQNKAIHNIAGLGIANGDRPFRPLAKPVPFEPRSSIRIQIEELETVPGTLFIVLQGYKLLGTGRLGG